MTFYDQPTNLLFFVAFFSLFKTAGANQIGINGGRQSVVVELAFPYVFVLGRTALCLNYTTVSSVYFAISTSTLLLLLRWVTQSPSRWGVLRQEYSFSLARHHGIL